MCEKTGRGKSGGKGKPTLGVFGLVTAAAFGLWVKVKVTGSHTAPAVKAPVQAAQVAATGSGISTGAVVVWAIVAAVFTAVTWFVVGRIRDMIADRRDDRARTLDQIEQVKARAQQRPIEPRVWRYTLSGTAGNGESGTVSNEFVFPSRSRAVVQREVLRRAYAKDPNAKLSATVELVAK